MRRRYSLCALTLVATLVAVAAAQSQRPASQQPSRDTPAQKADAPSPPAALITGRVLAADTGRPLKRARVSLSGAELPGGRGALTNDDGVFELIELPAGRYTLTASKSGFVSLAFGQRRPLQAGTPLQLADGQEIKGVEFRLPRGSVVAGHVYDETGDPMPGIMVRVLRYQYMQGDRRLVPAGTTQTDDQGQYRVWGLNPGDYYVDAQARINLGGVGNGAAGGRGGPAGGRGAPPAARGGGGIAGAIAGVVGAIAGSNLAALFGPDDESQKAYAPTYFPGVTSVGEARPVTVGLSEESLNNDFALQLVRVARVAGHVTDPDGTPTWSGNVTLQPDAAVVGRGGGFGLSYGSRIQWDGSFAISNVPPGRYVLLARGTDYDVPQFASQPLIVGNADIEDARIVLSESATISGTVNFPAGSSQRPDLTQLRISATSTEQSIGGPAQGRVDKEGTFTITGVQAGSHLIRPGGPLRGWTMKAVMVEGRDVTDTPIALRAGETLGRAQITFTDRIAEINGTLTTTQGTPVTEYTVLAFPSDPTFWHSQSRHIMTARPDQNGKFRIRGLPAGSYYLATVDPAEQGEWFDPAYLEQHRIAAARVTLGDGDTKTQDFRIRTQ